MGNSQEIARIPQENCHPLPSGKDIANHKVQGRIVKQISPGIWKALLFPLDLRPFHPSKFSYFALELIYLPCDIPESFESSKRHRRQKLKDEALFWN